MRKNKGKTLLAFLSFALGFYVLAVVSQPFAFGDRLGLSAKIAGVDVGFLNADAATQKVARAYSEYSQGNVYIDGKAFPVNDLVRGVNAEQTIQNALLDEERGYFGLTKYLGSSHQVNLVFNDAAVSGLLLTAYDKKSIVPVDATIKLGTKIQITSGQVGQRLLLAESRQDIYSVLAMMGKSVQLRTETLAPELTEAGAKSLLGQAQASLDEPITILGGDKIYQILPTDLHRWLKVSLSKPKTLVENWSPFPTEGEYNYLDRVQVAGFVDSLSKNIDVTAQNAKLAADGGRVVVNTAEIIGRTVDRNDAVSQIQAAVTGERVATLRITETKPQIRSDNLQELGLSELISTGWTDFSGSPTNRIHNLTTGASKFNGVLINPGEDFSFNKALGPVDASTGYLPELVILADKTVPEYGGGLCQVSSTAFRAALNAGMPILERHAHAYPVGYYKPYGVDATIYLPTPDLRFANDTGKYILVQTRIEGKKLYFDFYGTKKPVTIMFSGNDKAIGAVTTVEKVSPTLSDQGVRGNNSFTAVFYRHIYDVAGRLTDNDKFTSKYDSPDKYPH